MPTPDIALVHGTHAPGPVAPDDAGPRATPDELREIKRYLRTIPKHAPVSVWRWRPDPPFALGPGDVVRTDNVLLLDRPGSAKAMSAQVAHCYHHVIGQPAGLPDGPPIIPDDEKIG